jgi:hypothetical protein
MPLYLYNTSIAPLNLVLLLYAKTCGWLFLFIQVFNNATTPLKVLAFITLI